MRTGFVDAVIGDLRQDMALLTDASFRLLNEVAILRDNQAAAGIEILPDEGRVRIAAVAKLETEVGQRLTSLSILVDALKGQIELYGAVQGGDIDGIINEINVVHLRLDAVAGAVSTLATSAQLGEVSARVGTAEQTISANTAAIEQRATLATVNEQGTRLTTAEQRISAAEGLVQTVVQTAGTSAVDLPMMVGTLSQLLDYLGGQVGALTESFARAETNTSANIDEQGRAVAQVSTRLLVFQGEASAQFATVTRAIASANEALVQTQTLLQAQIGQASASVTAEAQARVAGDTAQAIRTDGLLTRMGAVEAGLVLEREARSTYDATSSRELLNLYAITGGQSASITSLN